MAEHDGGGGSSSPPKVESHVSRQSETKAETEVSNRSDAGARTETKTETRTRLEKELVQTSTVERGSERADRPSIGAKPEVIHVDADTLEAIPYSKPTERGFNEGAQVRIYDGQGRLAVAEGWGVPEAGKKVDDATRLAICRSLEKDSHCAHLLSRGVGGGLEANTVDAPDKVNLGMSSFEKAYVDRVRGGECLYFRGIATYESPDPKARASALELQVWKRDEEGEPQFVDRLRYEQGSGKQRGH